MMFYNHEITSIIPFGMHSRSSSRQWPTAPVHLYFEMVRLFLADNPHYRRLLTIIVSLSQTFSNNIGCWNYPSCNYHGAYQKGIPSLLLVSRSVSCWHWHGGPGLSEQLEEVTRSIQKWAYSMSIVINHPQCTLNSWWFIQIFGLFI